MYTGYYTYWKSIADLVNKKTAILFGIIAISHSDRKQMLCAFQQKKTVRFKYFADLSCPLCPHMDNALHMLSGCQHSTIRNMITERHKMANRKTITALTKSVHGANLFILTLKVLLNLLINAWAPRLLLQMLPPCLLPGLSDQAIETSSRPYAILILRKGSPHEYIRTIPLS